MATDKQAYPSDTADKFMARLPEGMRDRIAEAAKSNNRSMNSELVARLEASFGSAKADDGLASRLEAEVEQLRALANSFRSVADLGDTVRVTLSAMLARALELSPGAARKALGDEGIVDSIASYLQSKDPRGAAFSVVELLDGSTPELVEHFRNFASHIEDLGLYRKPIQLTVRGRPAEGPRSTMGDALAPFKPRISGSVAKVILDADASRKSPRRSLGDNSPPGPIPSPNARRPAVKKSPK